MVDHNDKFLIGDILKQERLQRGYTRDQIAERAEIGTGYLIAIENDEKNPKFDVLCRLVRAIGLAPGRLFYPEREEKDDESSRLIRLLQNCNDRDRKLVAAIIDTLVDTRKQTLVNKDEREGTI